MITQVLVGLEWYKYFNHQWPPRFTTDPDGKPHSSWRAILISQIDFQVDKDFKYDIKEPWNSPGNLAEKTKAPIYYSLVHDYLCHLILVYPGNPQFADLDVSQSLGDIVILAELNESNIAWSEPRDSCSPQAEQQIRDAISKVKK